LAITSSNASTRTRRAHGPRRSRRAATARKRQPVTRPCAWARAAACTVAVANAVAVAASAAAAVVVRGVTCGSSRCRIRPIFCACAVWLRAVLLLCASCSSTRGAKPTRLPPAGPPEAHPKRPWPPRPAPSTRTPSAIYEDPVDASPQDALDARRRRAETTCDKAMCVGATYGAAPARARGARRRALLLRTGPCWFDSALLRVKNVPVNTASFFVALKRRASVEYKTRYRAGLQFEFCL
jgi:hypothetical protein